MRTRIPFHLYAIALAGLLGGCAHSATAPKPRPATDPYEVIYVVDDFPPPIDTLHVSFSIADTSQGFFNTQEETLDTLTSHSVACFSLSDTLGQRFVTLHASTDTGVVLNYDIPAFDPAAGVDTTGGVGTDPSKPWVWRWKVGDSTVTGFARPATWAAGYCKF